MKTNRFLVVAGVSLAMALTLSCSDDDDGGGAKKACLYKLPSQEITGQKMDGSLCMRANVEIPKEGCDDGTLQESCPSNPGKACPMKMEGHDVEVLLYGWADLRSCKDWEDDFNDDDED